MYNENEGISFNQTKPPVSSQFSPVWLNYLLLPGSANGNLPMVTFALYHVVLAQCDYDGKWVRDYDDEWDYDGEWDYMQEKAFCFDSGKRYKK